MLQVHNGSKKMKWLCALVGYSKRLSDSTMFANACLLHHVDFELSKSVYQHAMGCSAFGRGCEVFALHSWFVPRQYFEKAHQP
jgi:hypothetical protein